MRFQTNLANYLLNAGKELGYNIVDLNDMTWSSGFMPVQVTGYDGARWSSDYALKNKIYNNKNGNLKILTNTLVEKVLFRNGYEANGVQYERNGRIVEVNAKKSVILSAGTIGTAKILLLSGIGPKEHLSQHNINPLVNLPVGNNLQDHITTGLDLVIINETLPISSNIILKSPFEVYNYIFHGKGVLTHSGCEIVGVFNIKNETIPDLQIMALPAGVSTDAGAIFAARMGISNKIWQEYFAPLVGKQVISILPTLLHPKSHGFVRLKSSNPKEAPVIDPKYLTDSYDVKILIEGLKLVQKLIKTKSFKSVDAKLYEKPMPGCENFKFGSDNYWKCYIKHLTLTSYHPVGTCKMGLDESSSVVDHRLRVHRTNNLYVIDASIMPSLPSANTNAAVMMIAEKGADLIKYLWHINKHSCHIAEIFIPSTTTTTTTTIA
ncbi:hypothetical protein O3M35_012846 [Rhynocoris fuscipes]|uniref:Glucose dehydrogenase n=1 Tax=Rhynocoris fuscipes TaxID=488301 RepID=A0AAW1CET2_9HEMI